MRASIRHDVRTTPARIDFGDLAFGEKREREFSVYLSDINRVVDSAVAENSDVMIEQKGTRILSSGDGSIKEVEFVASLNGNATEGRLDSNVRITVSQSVEPLLIPVVARFQGAVVADRASILFDFRDGNRQNVNRSRLSLTVHLPSDRRIEPGSIRISGIDPKLFMVSFDEEQYTTTSATVRVIVVCTSQPKTTYVARLQMAYESYSTEIPVVVLVR